MVHAKSSSTYAVMIIVHIYIYIHIHIISMYYNNLFSAQISHSTCHGLTYLECVDIATGSLLCVARTRARTFQPTARY